MPAHQRSSLPFRPDVNFVLLVLLLGILWIAGGASQANVLGQAIVRGAAWGALVIALLLGRRPSLRKTRVVAALLLSAVVLVLVQLVPLPPVVWQTLPGRDLLANAAMVSGQEQPWRPLSVAPGATINAASSLIVPVVIFLLAAGLREKDRVWLPGVLLTIIVLSTIIGLLQFSGASFDNALTNASAGDVSGMFANRNHFALLLAMGCILAPVWAFQRTSRSLLRAAIAAGLVLLFALTILASGSRAGLAVGAVAIALGLFLVGKDIRHALRHAPRWVFPALVTTVVAVIAAFVIVSVLAGRAEAINRIIALDPADDMRARGLPVALKMIAVYFPVGTGFGSFDPVFRMHEPFDFLNLSYFNHAHNDFVEIVLDGGILSLILLLVALGWWLMATIAAWRARKANGLLPLAGSAMLFLILLASSSDYPARTPMMMAMIVIAALWLERKDKRSDRSSPSPNGH